MICLPIYVSWCQCLTVLMPILFLLNKFMLYSGSIGPALFFISIFSFFFFFCSPKFFHFSTSFRIGLSISMFCFIYFEAMFLGAQTLRIAMYSSWIDPLWVKWRLSLIRFFVLISDLFDTNKATSSYFSLVSAWHIFSTL